MPMKYMPLVLALAFPTCLRGTERERTAPPPEDLSIAFPSPPWKDALRVDQQGVLYELDGDMLRALMVATQDFLPSGEKVSCRDKPEAHSYRVIRQAEIIFVYIQENPASCGRTYPALDSGAKYAIASDGRILRRIRDGEPDGVVDVESPDAGSQKVQAEPGVAPLLDDVWNDPSRPFPPGSRGPMEQPPPRLAPDGG